MRKRLIAVLLSGVVCVSTGCGAAVDKSTSENTKDVETTTTANNIDVTTTIADTTDETETTDAPEETTTNDTDAPTQISGFEDFDINAERIDVKEDALIEGYDFSDSVFIGDSRTQGLTVYGVLTTSTVLATKGLMAISVLDEEFVDLGNNNKGTVIDYLKTHSFKKAYVMFGINELGCSINSYVSSYKAFIDELKNVQPEMQIYILPIIPMVEERTDEIYNNEVIAVFNSELVKICEEEDVPIINVSAALINENGTLEEDYSRDGIHLNVKGLTRMVNYIILATGN